MDFIIFRARSREMSQLPLPGRFLSRLYTILLPLNFFKVDISFHISDIRLYITMEVEHRIARQYKCHYSCVCKNYWRKGDGGCGGNSVFASFPS